MAAKDETSAYTKGLSSDAKAEFKRLWSMRVSIPTINEITAPTLAQYCMSWSTVQRMLLELPSVEAENQDKFIDRLTKMQKIMVSYMKLLKLDEKAEVKPKNKFEAILMGSNK